VRARVIASAILLATGICPARSEDKINYQDHILPLVEANCSKCHNSDKKKADLDLTSYQGAIKGSGSGVVLNSGNVDGSKLWKALTHSEEPYMPPNRPKLPDKELELFRKWIAGGLLESANGKAVPSSAPLADLSLKPDAIGKPDGPPPMPSELPIEPSVHTRRLGPILGLAASPWAPLVAVAGQRQLLLYHTDTRTLAGILPFPEGQPDEVRFSQNGKLLIAAGGRGAKSGRVLVWDITNGQRLMTLGNEYDTVLTCDIRPDQSQVAMGGPSRLIKIYSTRTGEVQSKIKKHTDWVTAVAYSPNGKLLASADRNGGISIWDPENAQELFTLAGHKSAVTALSWRPDSKLLASSSEDGSVKVWEMQEGKQVKNLSAHNGGVLWVSYGRDGRLVTCGRDGAVVVWNSDGGKLRALPSPGEMPLRAVFSNDGKQVFAANFLGQVIEWNEPDWKQAGELDVNPLPLAEQLDSARKRVIELQAGAKNGGAPDSQKESIAEARRAVARLEAARLLSSVYRVRESLAAKRLAAGSHSATPQADPKEKTNASAHETVVKTPAQKKTILATADSPAQNPRLLAAEIKAEETELDKLLAQYHTLMSESEDLATSK
jgi:WD40 repeat protein